MQTNRRPDFSQFLKAVRRDGAPEHLPFYEHIASPEFIATRMGVASSAITWANPDFAKLYVDFWIGMNYDCVPMEIALSCPLPWAKEDEGTVSRTSEASACIRTMEDFEKYPWPDPDAPEIMEEVEWWLCATFQITVSM